MQSFYLGSIVWRLVKVQHFSNTRTNSSLIHLWACMWPSLLLRRKYYRTWICRISKEIYSYLFPILLASLTPLQLPYMVIILPNLIFASLGCNLTETYKPSLQLGPLSLETRSLYGMDFTALQLDPSPVFWKMSIYSANHLGTQTIAPNFG